jgi:hypothetical protein
MFKNLALELHKTKTTSKYYVNIMLKTANTRLDTVKSAAKCKHTLDLSVQQIEKFSDLAFCIYFEMRATFEYFVK